MVHLSALLLSIFITIALIPILSRLAVRFNVGLDHPDARKVHQRPVPRVGGIAITLGVYGSGLFWNLQDQFLKAYLMGSAIIVLFGILDDIRGLDFRFKFLSQVVAALVIVIYGGIRIRNLGGLLPDDMLLSDSIAIPLTVVAIVGVTNAVNLADGLDGLAGGICLLSFCCLGYLAYLDENPAISILCVALAGSIFGFLRYNTYPAELFMGDTGSQFLGFSAICLSLCLTQGKSPISPLVPVFILGFPILDTLSVMAQRIADKKPIFLADKNHFHHKLMRLGLSHTESVVLIYALQALLVVTAFVCRFQSEWFLLSCYVVFSALILAGFHFAESTHWSVKHYHLFDTPLGGRLTRMREQGIFVKVSFRIILWGIPFLLFVTCLIPPKIPSYFALISAGFLGMLAVIAVFRKKWTRLCLMVILYLFIPFVIALGAEREVPFRADIHLIYILLYAVVVFFVVLTLKLTRRRQGFKITPMDFLILFIALAFPYFMSRYLRSGQLALVAAETVMFFFSYEVIMGELRGKLNGLVLACIPSLSAVIIRGAFGW
jgi:UDP-GlcNAc:undecaprenyl-phosphate GlcNAc-1-phosphate transferase